MRTFVFQNYVAEGIRAISENSAKGHGKYISKSLEDIIKQLYAPAEARTADDIIDTIKQKLQSFGEEDNE